jgi:hypothetical protein
VGWGGGGATEGEAEETDAAEKEEEGTRETDEA